MENQHRQIKGYRELNQDEIDLMNKIKQKGIELEELYMAVLRHNYALIEDSGEGSDLCTKSEAARWANIAKTDFQTGLMALTRAVAKPEFF